MSVNAFNLQNKIRFKLRLGHFIQGEFKFQLFRVKSPMYKQVKANLSSSAVLGILKI